MHLIKVPVTDGGYQYAVPEREGPGLSDRLIRMLKDCVLSVEAAGQMVVVKTLSGSANTAAEALDSMDMPEILGSIAGDNTIFLVAADPAGAQRSAEKIRQLTAS